MPYVSRWIRFLMHPYVMMAYFVLIAWVYMYVDGPLALYMHACSLETKVPLLFWITQLARTTPYLVLLPFVAVFFRYVKHSKQQELRIWFLWVTIVLTSGICFIIKILLGRARPALLFDQHIFGFYGYHTSGLYHSLPSGHTNFMTTLVLSLTLLYPKQRWIFLTIATIVLATRVLLTYHYLSDVLATIYLVMLEYQLLLYMVKRECPLLWTRLRVI
ncbi:MAG TPA: phosphatase PAP2 family protein [Legionellaceae bacterium]|nr:phosphatase PAP2 family protein [Legionellaceae bacterium]